MQLDDRAVEGGEGIVQRPGIMGEGSGVDDDGVGPTACPVDGVDECSFVIGLLVLDDKTLPAGLLLSGGDMVGQRCGPVDLGLSVAEEVEVGP
jgi:hypothetical protein